MGRAPQYRAGLASSDRIRSRPTCCSGANTSMPANGPEVTLHGSEPMNVGVRTISSPNTKQLTLRWWPSNCHPHGSSADGVPKIDTKYGHSPNSSWLPAGLSQHLVEAHDVARLGEPACRQRGPQHVETEFALCHRQVFEHHPVTEEVHVHVEPITTFGCLERKARRCSLGRRQRIEEGQRRMTDRCGVDGAAMSTEQAWHDVAVGGDATQRNRQLAVACGNQCVDRSLDRRHADDP